MMPDKTAITSGGAGDILISIPVMRGLGIGTLYIKESYYPQGYGSMFSALKELMEYQGFIILPTRDDGLGFDRFDPAIRYDVNMDAWRGIRGRGRDYIGISMAMWFRCALRHDWKKPWLRLDDRQTDLTGTDYTLWSLTPRWRQSDYDWKKGYASVPGDKYFVGFESDWEAFCALVGEDVPWCKTIDFMATARLIRDCRALYCNQGVCVAIAQSIFKEYHCAFKSSKTNVRLYTNIEYAL